MNRARGVASALVLFCMVGARAQDHVIFSGHEPAGVYDPSWGFMVDPSRLVLEHEKLSVDTLPAGGGVTGLSLRWNSKKGGAWGAAVASPGWLPFDLTLRDSLRLTLRAPAPIAAGELPSVSLEDIHNWHSGYLRLGTFAESIPVGRWVTVAIPSHAFREVARGIDVSRVKCVFFGQDSADGNDHSLLVRDMRACGGSAISGHRLIVVIGSSVARGSGAESTDSTWAGRFDRYIGHIDATARIVNLAVDDYTTCRLMPDGHTPPPGRASPDLGNNICTAMEFHPLAIILSVTSEDVACGYSIHEQMANYDTLSAFAAARGVPLWIATTQPRRFAASAMRRELAAARDSLVARFGATGRLIDFWSDFADADGGLRPEFDSGDGFHPNDAGHGLMFRRVVAAGLEKAIAR